MIFLDSSYIPAWAEGRKGSHPWAWWIIITPTLVGLGCPAAERGFCGLESPQMSAAQKPQGQPSQQLSFMSHRRSRSPPVWDQRLQVYLKFWLLSLSGSYWLVRPRGCDADLTPRKAWFYAKWENSSWPCKEMVLQDEKLGVLLQGVDVFLLYISALGLLKSL